MKWVQPDPFFDQLGAVLDEVPPLPGEESLYAQFPGLLATAAKDYLTRLAMAKSNIFVNRNDETVYFYQYRDGAGQRLNGANRYTMTFKKGAQPPVHGFWSLTMYNQEHFFNVNDLGRYALGTKNKTLHYADDGSLTIDVQHGQPADNRVSNWLPSPDDDFGMTIRCNWPEDIIQNGDWLAPVVEMVE